MVEWVGEDPVVVKVGEEIPLGELNIKKFSMGDEVIGIAGDKGIFYSYDPKKSGQVWILSDIWKTPQLTPSTNLTKTGKTYPELKAMLDQLQNKDLWTLLANHVKTCTTCGEEKGLSNKE